jgi:hypothetical protein
MIRKALEQSRGMRWVCRSCDKKAVVIASAINKQSTYKCEEKLNKRIDELEETMKTQTQYK